MTAGRQSCNRLIVVSPEDLSRAQLLRLATLGRLTASVSHDLNNVFTVIQLHAALAENPDESDPALRGTIHRMGEAASRGSELVRRVLNWVRGQPDSFQPVDLERVIDGVVTLVSPLLGRQCTLTVSKPDEHLKPVIGNSAGLEQILMNLILNAADAMPTGGAIQIITRNVPETNLTDGQEFVEIAVRDEGRGVDPEALQSLFRPFYTSKDEGTGLGLSIVQEWVDLHQGTICVDSNPGQGTCFRVRIPVASDQGIVVTPENVSGTRIKLGRSILLVEDDAGIRRLGAAFLKKSGWDVYEAASADEALTLWSGHRNDIGLLFTDLVLGGDMNGRQLAETLQTECANLPVIFTSGYYSADGAEEWLSEDNFLPKPFHPRKLSEMVRRVHGMA